MNTIPLRLLDPRLIAVFAGLTITAASPAIIRAAPAADPLPSWTAGVAKQAILDYVRRVSNWASPDHVPEPERIAVFDNDGTLWPEYPLPFQAAFAVDRLRARVAAEPTLRDDPLVKSALAGDLAPLMAGDRHEGLLHVAGLTHAGLTVEEFRADVAAWMNSAEHPRFKRRYDRLTYQPMQELLAFLRANGFKTWIVSGGGADFMRVWSERVYGIPAEQVIGTTGRTRFELRPSGPVLVKTLEHLFVDDKAGKPAAIHHFLGRRPIACFGNSDGDLEMLQYTTVGNPRPSLGVIVHHTDGEREYAYDAHPKGTGRLVKALADAPRRGWTVVDMKRDWARVFADDAAANPVVAEATRLEELDRLWAEVARAVREGDFEAYAATCHPEGVLVNETKNLTQPLAAALARWRQEFLDTRAGRMKAEVEIRLHRRLGDATTAHESGIFRYSSGKPGAAVRTDYVPFRALLVKHEGRWRILMEHQLLHVGAADWEGLAPE